jgi:hypothetical protein
MTHTTYHLIANDHDQFIDNFEDVKNITAVWQKEGDTDIKVYKITTEEQGSDAILLDEVPVQLTDM